MDFTAEQIEARARELHETRKANTARRSQVIADLMTFDGGERDFCLTAARNALAEEADKAKAQTAEDRWYADELAKMSDDDIEADIARIDREVAMLPHLSLRVNIADRRKGFDDSRRRLVAEQFRRSVAAHSIAAE